MTLREKKECVTFTILAGVFFFKLEATTGPFVSMRTADSTTLEKVRDKCGTVFPNCEKTQLKKRKQPWHFKI